MRRHSQSLATYFGGRRCTELQCQLDDKKIQLDVDDSARDWLAKKGFDKAMGARPMSRLIQDMLKKPLAEEILFGELSENGGVVHFSTRLDELEMDVEPG